jgi:uncharacterized membrane protein
MLTRKFLKGRLSMLRTLFLLLISVIFVVGGIMHFTHDADLVAITPLPFAYPIVWVTGVMELLFVVFLWLPRYRVATGLWLSVFCLLVLPANINMAINDLPMFGEHVEPLIRWLRIPAQFGLILLILYAVNAFTPLQRYGLQAFIGARK